MSKELSMTEQGWIKYSNNSMPKHFVENLQLIYILTGSCLYEITRESCGQQWVRRIQD